MITTARRLLTVTTGALLALVALTSTAFAYPPSDGPDMGGSPPELRLKAATTASGSPLWVFLLVIAVTAALAVLATLTVVRLKQRVVVPAQ